MSDLSKGMDELHAEMDKLKADFTNAMSHFQGLHSHVGTIQTKMSSLRKQAQNESETNPETRATLHANPPATDEAIAAAASKK